jgi:hypothetical protein
LPAAQRFDVGASAAGEVTTRLLWPVRNGRKPVPSPPSTGRNRWPTTTTTRTRTMSTAHEEREAFGLLDNAVEALFDATRDEDSDPHDVPVDAVLLVNVQRVDDDGTRVGYVEVYPRTGTQSANIRGLVSDAGRLLDLHAADGDEGDDQP